MGTVLLFDIDGTLILTGGVGRRAMAGAFAKVHGASSPFEALDFSGMTDRAIIRHGLRVVAQDASEPEIDRVLDAYLALLEEELGRGVDYRILPGVNALLDSLHGVPDVAIGLGTGNVRRGAYAKLGRGALDGAFGFGGFGCDAEDRIELLRMGARRGAELLSRPLEDCRVVVIGDTPKDVAAAAGIGAACIAVGTGGFAPEALAGARRVFDNLAAEGVREALFEIV